MAKNYGYIRVSTKEQNEDRQLEAMRKSDVPDKNISWDKQLAETLSARSTAE